jgi:hypothetical protein
LIPRNPILIRDLHWQQQKISFLWGFLETVGIVVIALTISAAMLYIVVSTVDQTYILDVLNPIQLLAWTFHIVVVLRLLAAGAFAVTSDASLLGSDDLRLTPVTNWQLIVGTWWAAMHRVRGWILALGIVQIGIIASIGFALLLGVDWGKSCGSPCIVTIYGPLKPLWFTALHSFSIVMAVVVITMLESACCIALGMGAALVVHSRVGLIAAIALRFAPVVIFSIWPNYYWAYSNGPLAGRFIDYTWFSFADAGTGSLMQMAYPIDIVASGFNRGLLGLYAVVGMFLIYLTVSLVAVWIVLRRSRPTR